MASVISLTNASSFDIHLSPRSPDWPGAGHRNIGIYPSDRLLNIRQHGNSLLFADFR